MFSPESFKAQSFAPVSWTGLDTGAAPPKDPFDWYAPLSVPGFQADPRLQRMSQHLALVTRLRREVNRRR